MKTLLMCLFLLLCFNIQAQTNVYHPFPDSSAVWRENSGGYQCNCCSDYQYLIIGDTIINSFTYHKIKKSGVNYSDDISGFCTTNIILIFSNYIGAFREDTINKKIYFISDNNSYDTLLYDFNLSFGDTLPTSLVNNSDLYVNYVSLIDSIKIGNKYHKRYGISNGSNLNYVYLIEGIGSTFGLLGYLVPPFEFGTSLLCFKQDGQTMYPDSNSQCEIFTNKVNVTEDSFLFKIFPNPLITTAQIKIIPHNKPIDLIIYNVYGIKQLLYENINSDTKIEKGSLTHGLYFYQIVSKKEIINTGKIIIE